MLKKAATVVLATLALLGNAAVAHADTPVRTCRFAAFTTDGATYAGYAAGSITHAGGGQVTIQCYVTVNGDEVASTGTSIGETTAVVGDEISFVAGDTDDVDICTRSTTEHGLVDNECFDTTQTSDPSAILLCSVTSFIGGMGFNVLGLVVIEADGDVLIAGVTVLDCSTGLTRLAVRYG